MRHVSPYTFAPALFMLALVTLLPGTAEAQPFAFPGKFICGFEQGNVPFLNDPEPLPAPPVTGDDYEDLKPGNYATVFNVLNLNITDQQVDFFVSIEGQPVANVASLAVAPFGTLTVGCQELVDGLLDTGAILDGSAFEGFLIPTTLNANFVVDAVYTFESQNGFKEHIFVRSNGDQAQNQSQYSNIQNTLAGVTGTSTVYLGPAGAFPPAGPVVAGSGAGGLGLGVSIDVERLSAVNISPMPAAPPADTDPATEE